MVARILLLTVLIAAVPGCAVAQYGPPPPGGPPPEEGYEDDAPPPDEYDDSLEPYGTWGDDPQYGVIWHPAVPYGWRPYVEGHWVWSPYGWTWVSYEPWAWTFHYGRWVYVSAFGWSWVPGYVWGPAWVDWYWGDGFVGWAPLSPFASHVTVVNSFVFVNERDFCARRLRPVLYDHRRIPGRVLHDWHRRDFRAPDHERIERVSRHPVQRVDRRPPETIAPRGGSHLARPGTAPRLGGARRADRGDHGFVRPREDDRVHRGVVRPRQDAGRAFARPRAGDDRGRERAWGGNGQRRMRMARPDVDPGLGAARRAPVDPRPAAPAPGFRAPRASQPFTPPPNRGGGDHWSPPSRGGSVAPPPGWDARGMRGGTVGRGGGALAPRADRGHDGRTWQRPGGSPGIGHP